MKLNSNGVSDHSNIISEIDRRNLVGKTKSQSPQRFTKRLGYRPKKYNGININDLLNDDILALRVPVGDYTCIIAYKGVLDRLADVLKAQPAPNVTLQSVIRALTRSIDNTDILVDCSCPDFCLHEDTMIKLLNNEVVSVKDLFDKFNNNEEIWVYSTDKNGDFKPGKVTDVWVSGYSSKMIKVTLDNDKYVVTTPNHKFMLRDGSYCEAQNLTEDMSLMPLYFSYHNGYESVKLNSTSKSFVSVYKTVANELLSNEIEEARIRSGEDIIAIHHSDFNKLNNYPSNLSPKGKLEHWRLHYDIATSDKKRLKKFMDAGHEYWRTPEGRDRKSKEMSNSIRRFWDSMSDIERDEYIKKSHEWMNTKDGHDKMSNGLKRYWSSLSDEERASRCLTSGINLNGENGEVSSKRMKNYWESLDEETRLRRLSILKENSRKGACKPKSDKMKSKLSETCKLKYSNMSDEERKNSTKHLKNKECIIKSKIGRYKYSLNYIVNNGLSLTEENYYKYKRKSDPQIETYFDSFEDLIKYFGLQNYNHKVKSIEVIEYKNPIPVYDLTVENWNNFYVDAGVILHNCYRFAYWASKYGYKYGPPETRPTKITNPDDKMGAMCKHLTSLLSNKTWLVRAASILNNYIKAHPEDVMNAMGLSPDEFIINKPGRPRKQFTNTPNKEPVTIDKSDEVEDEKTTDETSDSEDEEIETEE